MEIRYYFYYDQNIDMNEPFLLTLYHISVHNLPYANCPTDINNVIYDYI